MYLEKSLLIRLLIENIKYSSNQFWITLEIKIIFYSGSNYFLFFNSNYVKKFLNYVYKNVLDFLNEFNFNLNKDLPIFRVCVFVISTSNMKRNCWKFVILAPEHDPEIFALQPWNWSRIHPVILYPSKNAFTFILQTAMTNEELY